MRKNNFVYEKLNVSSTFSVKGLNQDRLINDLVKKGVEVKNVRKSSNKFMKITINKAEEKKFFAITKNMCYNIKKVAEGGKLYFIYFLTKNLGLVVGCLLMAVLLTISNGYIYSVDYTGSGRVVQAEVQEFLTQKGITKYTRFSDINLKRLSAEILASNQKLSFVECTKNGNRLNVELALSNGADKVGLGALSEIKAEATGVIEDIKVYRGTALVRAGEAVSKGEVIVGGYSVIKDNVVQVNPIAYISIICTAEENYFSEKDNQQTGALILIENAYSNYEIINSKVIKTEVDGGFNYAVTLSYRYVTYK